MTKEERLAQVFGSAYVCKEERVSADGYRLIKERVTKNTRGDKHHILQKWMMVDRPVSACSVIRYLARELEILLQEELIPYYAIQKIRRTVFIIRDVETGRFQACLKKLLYQMGNAPYAFNYQEFARLAAEKEDQVIYFKYLTEEEMEWIRRSLTARGGRLKYAMFRMRNDKWGLGFQSKDLAPAEGRSSVRAAVLKSALFAAIALHGPQKAYLKERLWQDIAADRMAATDFRLSLKHTGKVYVFDPTYPKQALLIAGGAFSRVDILRRHSRIELKSSNPMQLSSPLGRYIYRKELLHMTHRKIAYSAQELMQESSRWHRRGREEVRQQENLLKEQQILTDRIYDHFKEVNRTKEWFTDEKLDERLVQQFKEEITNISEAAQLDMIPPGYTEKEGEALYENMARAGIDALVFMQIARAMDAFRADRIQEKFQTLSFSGRDNDTLHSRPEAEHILT